MNIKLIELYKALLEDALQDKRLLLDSGDYAGLLILLKEEDIKTVQNLFIEHGAIEAGWGSIIYLDKSKRTRMFISNSYSDKKFRFSTYISNFPTYSAVSPEWRQSADKFINHLNQLI